MEDTKPDDLAVIENDEPQHPMDDLVDLSEEGGSGGRQQILAKEQSSSPTSESEMSSLTSMESSDFESEEHFNPKKNEPVLTPVEPVPEPQQAQASKWATLPPREPSTRIRRPPKCYGDRMTTEEIDAAANETIGTAFVMYAREPCTIREALQSPNSKQWEKAIQVEYKQIGRAHV